MQNIYTHTIRYIMYKTYSTLFCKDSYVTRTCGSHTTCMYIYIYMCRCVIKSLVEHHLWKAGTPCPRRLAESSLSLLL